MPVAILPLCALMRARFCCARFCCFCCCYARSKGARARFFCCCALLLLLLLLAWRSQANRRASSSSRSTRRGTNSAYPLLRVWRAACLPYPKKRVGNPKKRVGSPQNRASSSRRSAEARAPFERGTVALCHTRRVGTAAAAEEAQKHARAYAPLLLSEARLIRSARACFCASSAAAALCLRHSRGA